MRSTLPQYRAARSLLLVIGLLWLALVAVSAGFTTPFSSASRLGARQHQNVHAETTAQSLKLSSSIMTMVSASSSSDSLPQETSKIRRLSVSGVSVSPNGFWMMLQVPSFDHVPKHLALQVTSDAQDAFAATSAESLTLLQLISGVDMAGPILPPEVLGKMTVLHCELTVGDNDDDESFSCRTILDDMIQPQLPDGLTYSQCNAWQQSRVKLPNLKVDEVRMLNGKEWQLECTIHSPQKGRVLVHPTPNILEQVCYQYDSQTSAAFISLALALRYKAPIVLVDETAPKETTTSSLSLLDDTQLQQRFPMFRTTTKLRQSSERVHERIERGFEIHKLTGALQIAMAKGDTVAAQKIRAKLDEYDSMEELPTASSSLDNNGLDQMQ